MKVKTSRVYRTLQKHIDQLAFENKKMAFVSGPRQCGKTTLAKMIIDQKKGHYYNWDQTEFRRLWTKTPSQIVKENPENLVVFDEIHKAKGWKRTLKGIFDTDGEKLKILVTGSARLNVFKKGGDSLMGRYVNFRLHGLSLGELIQQKIPTPQGFLKKIRTNADPINKVSQDIYSRLYTFGGFPEPFIKSSQKWMEIWRRGRTEKIVREDLRDLSRLPELSQIEMLCSILPEKIGSPLSLQSLAEDLEVSHHTIKRWVSYLNELYYLFLIRPFQKSISRSLKKEPKMYLYDWTENNNDAARFENLVGAHLLKACHYWTDTGEGQFDLFYLRNKEKKEVDFLITNKNTPWLSVECKLSDQNLDSSYFAFGSQINCPHIQLLHKPNIWDKKADGILVASAHLILCYLP